MASRRYILIPAFCLVVFVCALAAWSALTKPPRIAQSTMQTAFSVLRTEQTELYAPELTRRAVKAQMEATERWQAENRRMFFMRDYGAVDSLAQRAVSIADAAAARTGIVKDSLITRTEIGLTLLRDRIDDLLGQLEQLPHMNTPRNQILNAEAHLTAGERRQEGGDLIGAATALDEASSLLNSVGVTLDRLLDDYLKGIPEWTQWADEAIAWSKTHRGVSLVVDKMAHRCIVYRNGRELASFDVELGPRWIGPKRFEGDLSTPEGRYKVKRKRGPGETMYYLALEIDYPNDDDRRRFAEEIRREAIPPNARLGSNIELHGEGGKAFNWTKGCIALSNPEMRTVFDLVSVGTPIVIVGALDNPFRRAEVDSLEISPGTSRQKLPLSK